MELKDYFKKLTGAGDDVTEIYLERAKADIMDQTNRDELPTKMNMLILDVAVIYYTRANKEGISSMSEGAISVSYFEDLSPVLKSRILNYRLAPLASNLKKVKKDESNQS